MRLLTDAELLPLLTGANPIIRDLSIPEPPGVFDKSSPIQPSSVDLHIGSVVVPKTKRKEEGSPESPITDDYELGPGKTVVIVTKEKFALPNDIAAIAFPPSRISARGLLTTNPGHVDPGYSGPIHLTVINMARKEETLKAGMCIVTVLLFKLDQPAERGFGDRYLDFAPSLERENVDRLSRDFLSIQTRIRREVRSMLVAGGLIVTLVNGFVSNYMGGLQQVPTAQKYLELENKVRAQQSELDSLKARVGR